MRTVARIIGRSICLGAALLGLMVAAAAAETVDGLYQARVHVTGEEAPNRSRGFATGLLDVLVKLSGDPELIGDPAAVALGANAGDFVRAFHYRDLMAGIPVHDEQGTRQRPFVLTIDFDPAKVDAALKSLGRMAWTATRPRLIAFLAIDNGTALYLLASGGAHGRDQREALADSAWRYGMPIGLPNKSALDEAGLSFEIEPRARLARLQALAKTSGGDLAIAGTLVWTPRISAGPPIGASPPPARPISGRSTASASMRRSAAACSAPPRSFRATARRSSLSGAGI